MIQIPCMLGTAQKQSKSARKKDKARKKTEVHQISSAAATGGGSVLPY